MKLDRSLLGESTLLRPETISRRKLPLNLKEDDLSLFSHEVERVIPPTKLLRLQNVGASAEGVLFQGGKMLPESFAFPANRENWKRRSVLKFMLSNHLLRRRRRFDRISVWVTDDWSAGYFHWLADVLPRLLTVCERLKDSVLLLPPGYKQLEFVQASLKPFSIGNVEYIGASEALLCKQLLLPTQTAPSGHYNEELIREVRSLQVDCYANDVRARANDRIYISRSQAPKRRVSNEAEVIEVLRQFDFRIVQTEDLSFAEQVRMASRARYIVSNHGAGLTNILFMNPGSSVLELRCANDRVNNCYFTLASALSLNYFYQSCEPHNPGEDAHTADLQVEPSALRANLELMLKS
ncbi:MAG: glycosyltransferase family 61 protein [Pyrinomonadaceae bacterium]